MPVDRHEALRKLQMPQGGQSLSSGSGAQEGQVLGQHKWHALSWRWRQTRQHLSSLGGENSNEKFPSLALETEKWEALVGKGPNQSARNPPQPPPAPASLAEQTTHSSKLWGTAFRVYLEIILLFLLCRGGGGHARVEASGPGPPAGSGPAPSRHLPAPSRPVA